MVSRVFWRRVFSSVDPIVSEAEDDDDDDDDDDDHHHHHHHHRRRENLKCHIMMG
jgi:hypothetical protein